MDGIFLRPNSSNGVLDMTDFLLWTRGLRGPAISRLWNNSNLSESEKRTKLCEPIPIKPEHFDLLLSELAKLYPPPSPPEPPAAA